MTCPAATVCPTETSGRRTWWQYRVVMLLACLISTYQPQPSTSALPSTSQLLVEALHSTVTTMPPAAAWIGVPLGTERSTPSWVGRSGVRKPETISASTGAVQPEAAIWPAPAHCV